MVNRASITVVENAPISVEGLVPQRPSSAQITVADVVPTGVSLSERSKGVVVPIVQQEGPVVYKDGEDP